MMRNICRRVTACLLCAVLCLTVMPLRAFAASLLGDVNADGIVNTMDALLLYQHTSGAIRLTKTQLAVSDYNADGSVNTYDVLRLYADVAGTGNDDETDTPPHVTVRAGVTDESVYMNKIAVYNGGTGKTFTAETKAKLQMAVAEVVKYEIGMSTFGEKNDEAWKTMAVAAYTVLARSCYNGSAYNIWMTKDIDLTNATDKRIYNAVGEVLGIKIAYNDSSKSAYNQLCQVFYSASSAGVTCSTLNAWGYVDLEYLPQVDSAYDTDEWIKHYSAGIDSHTHSFSISMTELMDCLKTWKGVDTIYKETKSGEYSLYATKKDGPYWAYSNLYYYNSNGTKKYISGVDIYTAINYYHPTIHCYSHAITVTGESSGKLNIVTKGNGHGIGLSQYGVAGYANDAGWTYDQIIAHYYGITENTAWGLVGPKW